MALPLEGVKVLDFTAVMAGPYCTLMLADMGADVTKIETFPEGDGSRRFEPKVNGESYCFAVLNRNKKSIALDVKQPQGKEIFMQLAANADIIGENYLPGVTGKLGIDYNAVKTVNPGIIYASISGFGQTGPYSKKGGFDIIAQGMSGIMRMTGEPGGRPVKVAKIGVLAGLASFIPYAGFLGGLIAAALAAYLQFQDWLPLLWVAGVFLTGQVLESLWLTPRLVGNRIGLHPVAVIFAVMAGGQLFGFTGVLLALPAAAVLKVWLRHVHRMYAGDSTKKVRPPRRPSS